MGYIPPSSSRTNFPAALPERSVPQRSTPGVPEYVRRASVSAEHVGGVTLTGTTQTGKTVAIQVCLAAPGIVRVLLHGDDLEPRRRTRARELALQDMAVSLEKSAGRVMLRSDLLRVAIDLEPFQLTFFALDGQVLLEQQRVTPRFGFSAAGQRIVFHDAFTAEPDEHFYGFGGKFTEFDKRGQRLAIANSDADSGQREDADQNVPFFVSSRGYGLFVDSAAGVNFDMAHSNQAAFSFVVSDNALDYYVIAGPDLKSVLSRYASLIGFPLLPPKQAFGLDGPDIAVVNVTAREGGPADCTYPALASALRCGLSLGMCGNAFWSHDIGDFHSQPTPEVFMRWVQFGLFSPLSRMPGTTRLTWEDGAEALRIFSAYTRLRQRLEPYIYTYARLAAETGLPLLRPMVLEFPADPNTYALDLQYMFGAEFLVAPIYNSSGHRPVYLPAGKWVDFYTHEVITGPQTRFVDAPLDVLPLYVRANALIPTIAPGNAVTDAPFEFVIFDAYLLNRGSFALRDADGVTALSTGYEGSQLNLELAGVKKHCGVRVLPLADTPVVDHIQVNGARLNRFDRLEIESQAPTGWTRAVDGTIIISLDLKEEESS